MPKYLIEYTPYAHKQLVNSEKELLDFIFHDCGGIDKYIKVYEITDVDISKLKSYNVYREQKQNNIIDQINSYGLKIAYYEDQLSKILKIDCREFKSFVSGKILEFEEEIKILEEELKSYE